MREIKEIIIHCSATKSSLDYKLKDIERWHKERQFPMSGGTYCGYHYVIDLDGRIEIGKPLDYTGCHCKGHNANSIGICYIGGLNSVTGKPHDTRTCHQVASMWYLVGFLRLVYPGAKVYGHRDFANRDCPCFEVGNEFPPIWCGEK